MSWSKERLEDLVGAPSRVHIGDYRALNEEVEKLVEEINWRHGDASWEPIVFLHEHHGPDKLYVLYRMVAACVVTSLHDGMNLVSKEFVAARTDERGVLVLSEFTGAARELTDALLVNPYALDRLADAYRTALTMPVEEQQRRMRRMRRQVADNNIYRWAGMLLASAGQFVEPEMPCSPRAAHVSPTITVSPYLTECHMNDSLPDILMPLLAAYHSGEKLLLLFDYDGTLTPIVEHPWQAKLNPQTRELLSELAAQPHVHVGVLSGRRLDELEQLIGLPQLLYCGLSGIEMRLDGNLLVHPAARDGVQMIDEITKRLSAIERVYAGAWVEHKRYGFTVHYRGVEAALIDEVHTRILGFLESWSRQLRIVEAPLAVEVLIGGTWTKGDAVRKILEQVGEPVFVFYAGDADNDREAVEAVTAHGGIAVGVGPLAPSDVTAHVADPETLVGWFDALLHAIQGAPVEL